MTPITTGLGGPRDIVVDNTGTAVYVTEQNAGRLVRVDIDPASPGYTGVTPIASGLGGPRGLTLNQAGDRIYLALESSPELSPIEVDAGPTYTMTTILSGHALRDVALTSDERRAIVTEPAASSFPPGDLIAANLTTGNWSIAAHDIISGATSIVVNPSGTRAYYTQFGCEGQCTGKLTSWA